MKTCWLILAFLSLSCAIYLVVQKVRGVDPFSFAETASTLPEGWYIQHNTISGKYRWCRPKVMGVDNCSYLSEYRDYQSAVNSAYGQWFSEASRDAVKRSWRDI